RVSRHGERNQAIAWREVVMVPRCGARVQPTAAGGPPPAPRMAPGKGPGMQSSNLSLLTLRRALGAALLVLLFAAVRWPSAALATSQSFAAGSYIIPMDTDTSGN